MLLTQGQNNTIKNISKVGVLYLVATPIGNLEDITLRALKILNYVDFIFCEDTRKTKKLLDNFSIKDYKLKVYNDFSKEQDRKKILNNLFEGKNIALLSDAGTPLISDPGFKLVRYLIKKRIVIDTIPGVSSPIAALTLSGISPNHFLFIGFLPRQKEGKIAKLSGIKDLHYTLIFFESPRRLLSTLEDLLDVFGDRNVAVIRELTKINQEIIRDKLSNLITHYASSEVKGEIIIVVEGETQNKSINCEELTVLLEELMKKASLKDAVDEIVETYNFKRKYVYDIALKVKSKLLKLPE